MSRVGVWVGAGLLAGLAGLLAVVVWTGPVTGVSAPGSTPTVAPPSRGVVRDADPERWALGVLRGWDARRSAAWARASPSRLRAVYVPGSTAGAVDVRLLRAYRSRGIRVRGMATQVLALQVLDRRPGRLRLSVTDRLVGARSARAGRRVELPRDAASSRVLTLVRRPGGTWQVAEVREAAGHR